MAAAISRGSPARPMGTVARNAALASALRPVTRSSMSVWTGPGPTALTRTPLAVGSSAAERVRPMMACLLET
jgi:hypothetical protein